MNRATVQRAEGKLSQEIKIGTHRLVADVNTESGGDDAGPSPHDLLAAALGACTGITLRVYAVKKGWALENAEVSVVLNTPNADEMSFERTIRLVGNLDDTQKARLLEIANHCPVHRHLSGKIAIRTTLAPS